MSLGPRNGCLARAVDEDRPLAGGPVAEYRQGMKRAEFLSLLDGWLEPARFNDVAENGLQVEGRPEVRRIVCGVSANLALIDAAIERGADTIVVHHGLVWGGIRRLDGWLLQRVRRLVEREINLFAYHLPLDAQPLFGNNAGLAHALGIVQTTPFGRYKGQVIGLQGSLSPPGTLPTLTDRVNEAVGTPVAVFGDARRELLRVGVCTGGAPEMLHEAIASGLDAYVTGEVTEWVKAVAEESGTCFIAAGHHATERFGPRGLAAELQRAGLEAEFVDVENPV